MKRFVSHIHFLHVSRLSQPARLWRPWTSMVEMMMRLGSCMSHRQLMQWWNSWNKRICMICFSNPHAGSTSSSMASMAWAMAGTMGGHGACVALFMENSPSKSGWAQLFCQSPAGTLSWRRRRSAFHGIWWKLGGHSLWLCLGAYLNHTWTLRRRILVENMLFPHSCRTVARAGTQKTLCFTCGLLYLFIASMIVELAPRSLIGFGCIHQHI